MGIFDEGCMGMYNAIFDDEYINPLGIFKERLSQSALYYRMTTVSDEDAEAVYQWLELGPGDGAPPEESRLVLIGRDLDEAELQRADAPRSEHRQTGEHEPVDARPQPRERAVDPTDDHGQVHVAVTVEVCPHEKNAANSTRASIRLFGPVVPEVPCVVNPKYI